MTDEEAIEQALNGEYGDPWSPQLLVGRLKKVVFLSVDGKRPPERGSMADFPPEGRNFERWFNFGTRGHKIHPRRVGCRLVSLSECRGIVVLRYADLVKV